jgi:nucleotide-binding universal stress UspA family protein
LHFAKNYGASLHVVHSFLMPPTGTAVMVDITDILQKNAEEGLAKLREQIEKIELAKGIAIKYEAIYGAVTDVLERCAKKEKIDLIIMGTQGASGITEKFLGSNTSAAAKHLKTPLLAIPAEKPYKPISKVVIATDLHKVKNPEQFDIVERIAAQNEAVIRFLHVRHTDKTIDLAESEAYKSQMAKVFDRKTPVFTFIFDNDIEEGLSEALEKDGTDLLVVVQHERGFFQSLFHSSISQQLVNEAALPVLVLND